MRLVVSFLFLCTSAVSLAAQKSVSPDVQNGPVLSINFSVAQTTAVPGGDLKAGQYSLQIVDHLADRTILRITDSSGKDRATFLGVATTAASAAGPVEWKSGGAERHMLRGFSFPGGHALEFVYPKEQAVTIAQKNATDVLAIDPAGDKLKLVRGQLSPQDMQVVTLWSLAETRVGPGDNTPAISARPYRSQATYGEESETALTTGTSSQSRASQRSVAPVLVAGNRRPVLPMSSAQDNDMVQSSATARRHTRRVESASSKQDGAQAAALPQTGSALPLILAFGVLLMTASFMLQLRRRRMLRA